jgi:hypothetical protein
MSPVTQYIYDGKKWQDEVSTSRTHVAAVKTAASRDSLVYGSYEPSASTTGVLPGTVLTDYNSPTVNTLTLPAGTVIENKRIYGDIKPGGAVTLRNCLLVGGNHVPSGASAIVDCNGLRTGRDRIELTDCTLLPRHPSRNRDGIVGHHYNAFRCDISQTIDGLGIFITTDKGTSASVTALGNYIHDLVYFYPDYRNGVSGATWHSDGSHNDCIQIQGGLNIWIKGNRLEATSHLGQGSQGNPDKPWLPGTTALASGNANGACATIQDNTGAGIDNSVIIEQNYFSHGLSHANIKPNMKFIYRNNKHYRKVADHTPGWSGYWIRLDQRAGCSVTGLVGTNTWIDYKPGVALTEPRTNGMHFNV